MQRSSFVLYANLFIYTRLTPISDKEATSAPLPEVDRDNIRLKDNVWFLLLISSLPQELAQSLQEYSASRNNSPGPPARIDIGEFPSNQFS